MSKNRDNHVPSTFERGPVEEAETIVAESVTVPEADEPTSIPAQQSGEDVEETGEDQAEDIELKQKRFVKVTAFAKKNKKHIAIGALAVTALGVAIKVIFAGSPDPETVPDVEHTPEVDGSVDDN